MNSKILLLIIGIPGSGKSTLAEKTKREDIRFKDANIWEADMFFIDENGNYKWNPKTIGAAHLWCKLKVENDMKNGKNIIVSNTSLVPSERKPYIDLAKKYGYQVEVIECNNEFQNIHNVPEETIKKMKNRFVPFNAESELL